MISKHGLCHMGSYVTEPDILSLSIRTTVNGKGRAILVAYIQSIFAENYDERRSILVDSLKSEIRSQWERGITSQKGTKEELAMWGGPAMRETDFRSPTKHPWIRSFPGTVSGLGFPCVPRRHRQL